MTTEEKSLLKTLDQIVQAEQVSKRIRPIIERVRAELGRRPESVMAWEPILLTVFSDALPAAIRSAWVFILRAGADTGAERHPNSHQRMLTFAGTGDMQTEKKETASEDSNQISEEGICWQSNILVSDLKAPLKQRWISIPQNVWHRPVIPRGSD